MEKNVNIREKLEVAIRRKNFRTVDLFAGCGGLTLGFHRAGFHCSAGVEIDDDARSSHKANFAKNYRNNSYRPFKDITEIKPDDTVRHIEPLFPELTGNHIDVVIGGPPCQAFSRLGRAALWRLAGRDHAHADDERASMYERFLRYVARLKPLAFVMENVREIGKFVGRNVAEEIAISASDLGYNTNYTLLNAVWYGVPQMRERIFIVGIHKDLHVKPRFPNIQYNYDLPVGYSTSRAGTGHIEVLEPHDHYIDHLSFNRTVKAAITTEQAFVDLPPIYEHLDGRTGKGVRRNIDLEMDYTDSFNEFTKIMRTWPGFKNGNKTFTGHIIRYTPRDYETFRRMPHGGMYPEALETAKQIFREALEWKKEEAGRDIPESSDEYIRLYKSIVPPYKVHRYPNKFRKMWPDQPARTVPAHIGKDSYSHIHFDSDQARCISLREAARLQSFPDGFKFSGSMNSVLRQIGNAVPPLLAFAVAKQLKKELKRAQKKLS